MKESRIKVSVNTIIATILLIVSVVFLFLPWVQVSMKVSGRQYTLRSFINTFAASEGVSEVAIKNEMYDGIKDLSDQMAQIGVDLNAKSAMKAIETIYNGKVSIFDLVRTGATFGKFVRQLRSYAADSKVVGYALNDTMEALADASTSIIIRVMVLWVLFAATIIAFVIALWGTLHGKKRSILGYSILSTLLLCVFIYITISGNHTINEYGDMLEDLISNITSSNYYSTDFKLLHLMAAPIVCAILAWISYVVMQKEWKIGGAAVLKSEKVDAAPLVYPVNSNGWICNACGASVASEARFCAQCGAKKPEAVFCGNCGAKLTAGQQFCGECGAPAGK